MSTRTQKLERLGICATNALAILLALGLAWQAAAQSTVTWDNSAGTWRWNTTEDNWVGTTTFSPGDNVNFLSSNRGSVSIADSAGTPTNIIAGNIDFAPTGNNADYTFSGGGIGGTGSMRIGWDSDVIFSGYTTNSLTFSGGTTIASGWLYFRPDAPGTYNFGTGPIIASQRGDYVGFKFEPTAAGAGAILDNNFIIPSGGAGWYPIPNGGKILGTIEMNGNLSFKYGVSGSVARLDSDITLTGNHTISGGNNSRIYSPINGGGTNILGINVTGNQDAWTDWRMYVDDDTSTASWNIGGLTKTNTGNLVFSAHRDLGDELNLITGAVVLGGQSTATDLIRDTANINLQGGKLYVRRNGTGSETETVGAINIATGHNEIVLSTNANETRTLAASALNRTNYATALVSSNNLGGTGGGSGSGQLTLPSAPSMIGGAGAPNSTEVSIIPYLIGGTSVNDHTYVIQADRGSTFVTYDSGTGSLRALNTSTEFASSIDGVSGTTTNVRRTSAETLTADRTVNSLILNSDVGNAAFDLGLGGNTLTVNSGALLVRGDYNHAINIGTSVGDGYLDLNGGEGIFSTTSSNNYGGVTVKVNSVIQNGSLTKTGYSVLELHADNTFTGPLVVNSGGLHNNSQVALRLYGTVATKDIQLYGGASMLMADDRLPADSTVTIDRRGSLYLNGNDQTLHALQDGPNGGGLINNGTNGTLTLNPVAGNTASFSGTISSGTLIKDGPNRALTTGSVSPGTLILEDGVLRVSNRPGGKHYFQGGILELSGSYRDWSYNNQVHFGPGGGGWASQGGGGTSIWISGTTAQEWGVSPAFIQNGDPLMLNSTTADNVVRYDSFINLGSSGGSALREFRIADNPNTTSDYAQMYGRLSGDAGYVLWKTGDGLLTLTNNGNNFSGGTQISGGSLEVADDRRLGTAPGAPAVNITLDGGALQFGANMSVNANRTIQLNAGKDGRINTNGNTGTVPGLITGAGTLVKEGTGTLVLNAANDYTGGTRIDEGTLRVGNVSALGNGGVFEMTGGTLDLRDYNISIGPLSGSGGTITNNAGTSNTATLTTTVATGASSTFGGAITDGTTAKVALTKTGAGTLSMTGASTHTGLTTVAEGALLINGATTGQGSYDVLSGATLGGAGTIGLGAGNAVTINTNGTLSPGNSPGTLSVTGDLVFNDNAIYLWEVDESGYDSVSVDGELTFAENLTLMIDWLPDVKRPEPQTFVLFSYTGADPSLTNWNIQYLDSHLMGAVISVNEATNQILLNGLIPEPTTAILLAAGVAMLLNRRRRHR